MRTGWRAPTPAPRSPPGSWARDAWATRMRSGSRDRSQAAGASRHPGSAAGRRRGDYGRLTRCSAGWTNELESRAVRTWPRDLAAQFPHPLSLPLVAAGRADLPAAAPGRVRDAPPRVGRAGPAGDVPAGRVGRRRAAAAAPSREPAHSVVLRTVGTQDAARASGERRR